MSIEASFPTIKPTLNLDFANTKELDPRITFTRASTATYYNGETSALAEQNLLTFSEQFDNAAWTKSGVTVTANTAVAPNGTTTADKIIPSSASSSFKELQQNFTAITGQNYAYSIYLKENGYRYVQIIGTGSPFGSFFINYDLIDGVETLFFASTSIVVSKNIQSVGNGWWRISVVLTCLAGTTASRIGFNVIPASDSARGVTWSGDGVSGVLAWGVQTEERSAVTAYTPTTTVAITNYIPVLLTAQAGQARFDHNPNTGESLGLEIEEQRTNLVTYSGAVGGTNWTPLNIISTLNTAIAPDGTLTASNIIANTVNSVHYLQQLGSSLTAGTYTASCYIKAYTARYIIMGLLFDNNANRYVVIFDALNGVVVGTTGVQGTTTNGSSTISPVGNGWYKVSVTATTPTMTSGPFIRILNPSNNSTYNETNPFAGDGYSGVLVWGAQIEAGSFATSYIPTVASQVTRAADDASMTGTNFSQWYNPSEGSIFISSKVYDIAGFKGLVSIETNNGNFIDIRCQNNGTAYRAPIVYNTVDQGTFEFGATYSATQFVKTAVGYKRNDSAGVTSGASVLTDTLCTIPMANILTIGAVATNGLKLNGTIKQLAYYPLRLTNAQLQALTS